MRLEERPDVRPEVRPDMLNGLSIDVEEAFHASAFENDLEARQWESLEMRAPACTTRILDCLEKRGVKATFFVLGWVAARAPHLVRRIHAAGHEVGCHGYAHRRIYHQSPSEFRRDVADALARLQDLTGAEVMGYRAPTYSITPASLWAIDVLAELGFRYDSSIFPVRHDRYGFPGAPRFPYRLKTAQGSMLLEVPPSSLSLGLTNLPVAGGGYLRLYPLWFTQLAIQILNRLEQEPAFVYLHPWEIDPEQPRLTTRRLSWWRHSVHQSETMSRLESLLQRNSFGPFRDQIAGSERWPTITLETAGRPPLAAGRGRVEC